MVEMERVKMEGLLDSPSNYQNAQNTNNQYENPIHSLDIKRIPQTPDISLATVQLNSKNASCYNRVLLLPPFTIIILLISSATAIVTNYVFATSANVSAGMDVIQKAQSSGKLRFNWSSLELYSPLAKQFARNQADCDLPQGLFWFRQRYGLGSDLHVWSQGLCNAEELKVRIRTTGSWPWWDEEGCSSSGEGNASSPMLCYFPRSEMNCPGDEVTSMDPPALNLARGPGNVGMNCGNITAVYSIPEIRAAAMEFLFTGVSKVVQNEAERQLHQIFPNGDVPPNLITVHMRWGDKGAEMKLVPVEKYRNAVEQILRDRSVNTSVHIYLATEDPEAVRAFHEAIPPEWTVYVDTFIKEKEPYHMEGYNNHLKIAKQMHGRAGLLALGSLLVAMEANDFVLTTGSNWGRLMNELRKAVLDPRFPEGTRMIDLSPGEW